MEEIIMTLNSSEIEDTKPIWTNIESKLDFFLKSGKIPNIIFHGSSGSGKRTILHYFINKIYDGDRDKLKSNIMMVNCSHGKGIKFIRDELKFFAKTNIRSNSGVMFKSIVLLNADSLTIDAQSALRRCIELFSNNTRFFIVVEKIQRLLNPILSRFCEIYIPENCFITEKNNDSISSLYQYHIKQLYQIEDNIKEHYNFIINIFETIYASKIKVSNKNDEILYTISNIVQESITMYENGISALDIIYTIKLLHNKLNIGYWNLQRNTLITMCFYKIKPDLRCEKMMIFYILYLFFISLDEDIKNILLV